MPFFYKQQQIGTRRADFLLEGLLSIELKAIIGLRINFGSISMEFKLLTIIISNK